MQPTITKLIFRYLLRRTWPQGIGGFLAYVGDAVDQEALTACAVQYYVDASNGEARALEEYIQSQPAVKAYYDSLQ